MMKESELNISHSFTADSISLNNSRLAPRQLDASLVSVHPLPSKVVMPTRSSNNKNISESIGVLNQLQSKLTVDHSFANTQRDEESRIRYDLEQSKALLIEQYQLTEIKLTTELNDCKSYYEQKLIERETFWAEQAHEQQSQTTKLEVKLNDIVDMCRKRIADKDKINVEQLEQQEHIWKQRIEEMQQGHQDILNSLQSKHMLEKESRDLTEKARIDAKEDQIKAIYEKKMKKYESQIHDVMRNYHDKELIIHGSLDEARKEIVLMRAASAAKEDSLREELTIKDRLILKLQADLHRVDDITKIADSWRAAARDLARMVVQACVSIQDMPPVPLAPKDNSPNIFQGFGKPDEVSKDMQTYLLEVRAMNKLRKENVLVQRELIARTLRNSKKIVERVKAEAVPAFDFRIDNEE